jgi:predicted ATPase
LVGRHREQELLHHHLAGKGKPVLLVCGEPGIGKTRLLQEAAQAAPAMGLWVVEGGCQRRGGQDPYAPARDALAQDIQGQQDAGRRRALEGCGWLARLLPELVETDLAPLPAGTLPAEQERRLMFRAVTRYLTNVAGPSGTLLVLDDLQWAGPDALDLLAALARVAATVPLRVVGAYRDTEIGSEDPLTMMVADLAQAGLAQQLPVPPLPFGEAADLVERVLRDGAAGQSAPDVTALREQIVARAGGVPFFLLSCAQAARPGAADGMVEGVPWDVAHAVRQRVAALPLAARTVLGAAAVVGRVVPPLLLMAAAAQPEEEVLSGLEAASRGRLMQDRGAHGYEFAHDVIREVVEADLGTARRMVLHRRIAEALEQAPGELPVDRLAYHYSQGGALDKAIL